MNPLMKSINQTTRCGILFRDKVFKDIGLKDHQHAYIIHICSQPGITQEKLAFLINVNKSNVARQLSILEKNGLISRQYASDNRKQLCVFPTEKCTALFPIVKEQLKKWQDLILEDFSPQDKELVMSMMTRIADKAMSIIQTMEEDNV